MTAKKAMMKPADLEAAKRDLSRARTALLLDHPWFAHIAFKLRLEISAEVPTAGTDGARIIFNPAWMATLKKAELVAVFAHEVLHVANRHHTRRGRRDPRKWNAATDHAINNILAQNRFTLPKPNLCDPKFKGMSAEAIYPLLPEDGGKDWRPGNDPGGCGEVMDAPAGAGHGKPTDADLHEADTMARIAVAQATQIARARGALPAGIGHLVEDVLRPKADPWARLRDFVARVCRSDYSWARPNRRYIHQGLYLPSLRAERLGPVVVGIDVSGSIGEDEWREFGKHLRLVLEDYRPAVTHALYCDTKIHLVESFEEPHDFRLKRPANGGTDFRPVFEWADANAPDLSCLIFFTDLEGTFPDKAPGYPVLWAVKGRGARMAVPFGEVVELRG